MIETPKRSDSRLLVLEGRWDENRDASVRGAFDVFFEQVCGTKYRYVYERFPDAHGLERLLAQESRRQAVRWVYVAGHGSQRCLHGSLRGEAGEVSVADLRHALETMPGTMDGALLSCCELLSAGNVQALLAAVETQAPHIHWVAGYRDSPDFLHSLLLEQFFLYELMWHKGEAGWLPELRNAAAVTTKAMPGLVQELGFTVAYRDPSGGVQTLIAPTGGAA